METTTSPRSAFLKLSDGLQHPYLGSNLHLIRVKIKIWPDCSSIIPLETILMIPKVTYFTNFNSEAKPRSLLYPFVPMPLSLPCSRLSSSPGESLCCLPGSLSFTLESLLHHQVILLVPNLGEIILPPGRNPDSLSQPFPVLLIYNSEEAESTMLLKII